MHKFLVKKDGSKAEQIYSGKKEPLLIRSAVAAWYLNQKSSDSNTPKSVKIAAFDMDETIIKTKSGRPFARYPGDWTFLTERTKQNLQDLSDNGYQLVIFSNQKGALPRYESKSLMNLSERIHQITAAINRPVYVLCSLKDTDPEEPFRKPKTGMWALFLKELDRRRILPNLEESFYVGDAAGREGDHSDADIEFAKAIGLKFWLPEEWIKLESK